MFNKCIKGIFKLQYSISRVFAHLVVASVLVEQRDDGFNMSSLNDVQSLRAFYQDAVEDFQDSCRTKGLKINHILTPMMKYYAFVPIAESKIVSDDTR